MATTEYGVTDEGFKRKRLAEILSDMTSRFEDKLGVTIKKDSSSVIYHNLSVIGYEIDNLWSGLQDTYNAMYPQSASGVSLTNSASLTAIRPISAEQTTVYLSCYGDEGTVVPADTQVSINSYTYSLGSDTTISKSACCVAALTISSVVVGTVYSLTIDGTTKTYTAVSGDTIATVLTALSSQFSFTDRTFVLSNNILTITKNDQSEKMVIAFSNLVLSSVASPADFTCDTYGAIDPETGKTVTIITSVTGLNNVVSAVAATVGRATETDTELRQRWSNSVYKKASAMVEAIQANVFENVDGVTSCIVYENSTDAVDSDGRLPHSIEVVAYGGEDALIAKQILTYKASGIDTNGTVSESVKDSQGISHTINFNRPTNVPIWIKAIVTKDSESTWSETNLATIAAQILSDGEALSVGNDVILQKFLKNIYANVTGVGYVAITGTTGVTPGTYSSDNIVISARQISSFDAARIEVTLNE